MHARYYPVRDIEIFREKERATVTSRTVKKLRVMTSPANVAELQIDCCSEVTSESNRSNRTQCSQSNRT